MISVALIGAEGFVGSSISKALKKNRFVELIEVTRDNYEYRCNEYGDVYNVIINAACPSKRLWAKQNPNLDFIETVEKTAALVYRWRCNKFIQISTLSVRTESDSIYGLHRSAAEKIVLGKANHLIVRLTAMYDESLTRGALVDIYNKKQVYFSGDSRYSFTSLDFVGDWISHNLSRIGLVEVGAKDSISLREIADHLGHTIEFGDMVNIQEIEHIENDFPESRQVLKFMMEMKKKNKRFKDEQ